MKRKLLQTFLILLFIITLYLSASEIIKYQISAKKYQELQIYTENTSSGFEVDFDKLKEVNQDILAWIQIKNLDISYPVVKGNDNDYYLSHLVDKTYHFLGSIFLDYRNDLTNDKHLILYGHNANNKTMFGNLDEYLKEETFINSPQFIMETENETYEIEVFSVYYADTSADAWQIAFDSDEDYFNWLIARKKLSLYQRNIILNQDDRVITLSTCSERKTDERLLIVGKIQKILKFR